MKTALTPLAKNMLLPAGMSAANAALKRRFMDQEQHH